MENLDDMALVKMYAGTGSEQAFATLVARHLNFVYSTALRQVRNPAMAQDISQAVFIILARKARALGRDTILPAWLYRTARYASLDALNAENRRHRREMEAHMQSAQTNDESESVWQSISPLLDDALATLGEKDRNAIILRFLEEQNLKEVGRALGAGENTAGMRVTRALEKLRKFFARRGVVVPAAVIATAMAANSLQAAPNGLAASITTAIVTGSTAAASTLTLVKGALKLMAWTKLKTTVVVGVAVLLAAGGTVVAVKKVEKYREESFWSKVTRLDWRLLDSLPKTVVIRPAIAPRDGRTGYQGGKNNTMMAFQFPASELYAQAYKIGRSRIANRDLLPPGNFDVVDTLADQPIKGLQDAVRKRFGVVGKKAMKDTDVYVLTLARTDAPGLKPAAPNPKNPGWQWRNGWAKLSDVNMSGMTLFIENRLNVPVIDETGMTDRYDFELTWNKEGQALDLEDFKQAIFDQLGLQLTPTNQAINMLVLEKVK